MPKMQKTPTRTNDRGDKMKGIKIKLCDQEINWKQETFLLISITTYIIHLKLSNSIVLSLLNLATLLSSWYIFLFHDFPEKPENKKGEKKK